MSLPLLPSLAVGVVVDQTAVVVLSVSVISDDTMARRRGPSEDDNDDDDDGANNRRVLYNGVRKSAVKLAKINILISFCAHHIFHQQKKEKNKSFAGSTKLY